MPSPTPGAPSTVPLLGSQKTHCGVMPCKGGEQHQPTPQRGAQKREGGRAQLTYVGQLPVGKGKLHRVLQPRDARLSHHDAHHSVIQDLPRLVGLLSGGDAA